MATSFPFPLGFAPWFFRRQWRTSLSLGVWICRILNTHTDVSSCGASILNVWPLNWEFCDLDSTTKNADFAKQGAGYVHISDLSAERHVCQTYPPYTKHSDWRKAEARYLRAAQDHLSHNNGMLRRSSSYST